MIIIPNIFCNLFFDKLLQIILRLIHVFSSYFELFQVYSEEELIIFEFSSAPFEGDLVHQDRLPRSRSSLDENSSQSVFLVFVIDGKAGRHVPKNFLDCDLLLLDLSVVFEQHQFDEVLAQKHGLIFGSLHQLRDLLQRFVVVHHQPLQFLFIVLCHTMRWLWLRDVLLLCRWPHGVIWAFASCRHKIISSAIPSALKSSKINFG